MTHGAGSGDWPFTAAMEPAVAIEPAERQPVLATEADRGWRRWLGPVLSLAILGACVWQLRTLDWHETRRLVPTALAFWAIYPCYYLCQPAIEWVIFRRLWRLPAAGVLALLRKLVSNEILLGYSGELYFYSWARRHAKLVGSPFGAIKDVAILSAAVGNGVTLALLAAAWPLFRVLPFGTSARLVALSIGTAALSSLVTLLFRRALFSLPRRDLLRIAGMQLLRVLLSLVLAAALWRLVLPGAPFAWWLMLAAVRMLVSRLPFLPNKELVFAGLVTFVAGGHAQVADMLAMLAGLVLATHLLVGIALAGFDTVEPGARAPG